ncbi:MAG: MFS transporter [Candidatus Binatia bacterium]
MARPATVLGFDRNVFLLGITSLLNDISSEIIYPLLPAFLTTVLGAGPAYIGLIEGIAESTASVLKLCSGWLSDRLHRRKGLVLLGYGIAAAVRPLMAIAAAPWHVLVIRFSDRSGKGLRSAPRDALLAESSAQPVWGRSFGFHRAMDHLGAVIGPLIAFALLSIFAQGYRVTFALAAIPGALAVAVIGIGVRDRGHRAGPAAPPLRPRGALPGSLRAFLLTVLIFTLGNSTDAFLLLRAQNLGVSVVQLPLLWVVLHVVKSVSSLPGGSLSDRIPRKWVILLGWLLYGGVYLGFAVAGSAQAVWWLFATYGLFFGLTEGTEKALVADLVPARDRGTAYGFYHLTVGIAALPGSLICGALWHWSGPALAFTVGAGLAAVAAVSLLFVAPGGRS